MTSIEERIESLEKRIIELEKHQHAHSPVNPYKPFQPQQQLFNWCVSCGATGVSGYVCSRHDCPTKVSC